MSLQSLAKTRINSDDERTEATDRSSSRESSVSQEAERRPKEEKPTYSTEANEEDDQPEQQQAEQATNGKAKSEMKGYLNKDYRNLLNTVIEEAAGVDHSEADVLYPSHVGESFWTSEEKEAFFYALGTKGRDDLPGISSAVKTKGELEVRTYLLALENASRGDQVVSPAASESPSTDLAAIEIGQRCEHALNLTAEALERHVLQNDVKREQKKFRDMWLIYDDTAANVELEYREKEQSAATGDNEQVMDVSDGSSEPGPDAIVYLLKEEAFLQLSRSLFMNSAVDVKSNWNQLAPVDGEFTTPAIFRSALNNFHNITMNFTRWLVQATMFQAMSRLRAKDDQKPAPFVTTDDVKAAISFLNLNFDCKKYWAGVARRCGVEVYSDSEKFRDGRPGTKNGRLLTWDEVEAELGFPPHVRSADTIQKSEEDEDESANSALSEMSNGESADADETSQRAEHSDVSSSGSLHAKIKRKRSGRSSSDEDDEDQYLDSLDEQASRAEERRLMEMLRYSTSPAPTTPTEHARDARSISRRKRIKTEQRPDWRDHVDYMAEWEQRRSLHESNLIEESEE